MSAAQTGQSRRLSAAQVLAVQRQAGNTAVGALLKAAAGATPAVASRSTPVERVVVQRDPPVPSNLTPAAAEGAPAERSAWSSLKALADGSRKFRFGVPDQNLYRGYKGKDFSWSSQQPEQAVQSPLALGLIPIPPPVGPVVVQIGAGVSAYAGGNALVDVTVKDIVLEATAADLLLLGQAAAFLLTPGLQIVSLGMLASLNLKGSATLSASASASLEAGVRASLEAEFNSSVWPVAGYMKGSLGGSGSVRAEAFFDKPAQVELRNGRLRLLGGQTFTTEASLTPEVGLNAGIAAGIILGYRPLAVKRELWSHYVDVGAKKQLKAAIEGGDKKNVRLSSADDGTPVIELDKVVVAGKAILEALFKDRDTTKDQKDTNVQTGTGQGGHRAPTGTREDPIPITWWKPLRWYLDPVTLTIDGEKRQFQRDGKAMLPNKEAIGVSYWPMERDVIQITSPTKRSGSMQKAFDAALVRYGFPLAGWNADHVEDLEIGGSDSYDNLWPLEAGVNQRAGNWQLGQSVTFSKDTEPVGNVYGPIAIQGQDYLRGRWVKIRDKQDPP
jgi:hypothetical protein